MTAFEKQTSPSGDMASSVLFCTEMKRTDNSGVPLWFGMWVSENLQKIEGVKEYMASLGLDLLADVAIKELKHDILDSMEVQYASCTENKRGEGMDFRAGFFQLSPEHVAIAITLKVGAATFKVIAINA